MDSEIARKLSANFDEIKNAIVLRDLWRIQSSTGEKFEYNAANAPLGGTETGEILVKLLTEDMVKELSQVNDDRMGRWYSIVLPENFAERYDAHIRQLHIRSNMKQINTLIDTVKEELKLQAERGVTETKIGYENMPEGFATDANLYYSLLLMELDEEIVINCIKDNSRWVPSVKHPNRQHLRDFIFQIHSSEIPRTASQKKSNNGTKPIRWKNLKVIFDAGGRPVVYKDEKRIQSGGGSNEVRSADIKILAELIIAQGMTVQHHTLMDALKTDHAQGSAEQNERALHDSVYRLRSYAKVDCIANEKQSGYRLK